jgi:hypothetical protein
MSEISENITATFSNVIQIYEETASMLQDLDALMEQHGYRCFHGSAFGSEQSRQINYPKHWLIPFMSRYYANEETPMEFKGVSIFYLDATQTPIVPIIVYGCFLSEGSEVSERKYWYAMLKDAWFKHVDQRVFDEEIQVTGLDGIQNAIIRALLLEEIQDIESLEAKIVGPLLSIGC